MLPRQYVRQNKASGNDWFSITSDSAGLKCVARCCLLLAHVLRAPRTAHRMACTV